MRLGASAMTCSTLKMERAHGPSLFLEASLSSLGGRSTEKVLISKRVAKTRRKHLFYATKQKAQNGFLANLTRINLEMTLV